MRKALRVYAEIVLMMSYIVLTLTFFAAYINPTKTVLVTINTFGEATPELVLLVLAIVPVMARFKEIIKSWHTKTPIMV